jgi:hypothetical protein
MAFNFYKNALGRRRAILSCPHVEENEIEEALNALASDGYKLLDTQRKKESVTLYYTNVDYFSSNLPGIYRYEIFITIRHNDGKTSIEMVSQNYNDRVFGKTIWFFDFGGNKRNLTIVSQLISEYLKTKFPENKVIEELPISDYPIPLSQVLNFKAIIILLLIIIFIFSFLFILSLFKLTHP